MKFGVREICDVVLKAKAPMKIGKKVFYKNEPVIYFDSLKTSSMEGAATTVYAQGGRGNSRLMAWEGERTVTFTMEDALISPAGFMILSGAGLIEASEDRVIYQHMTEQVKIKTITKTEETGEDGQKEYKVSDLTIELSEEPVDSTDGSDGVSVNEDYIYVMALDAYGEVVGEPFIATKNAKGSNVIKIVADTSTVNGREYTATDLAIFAEASVVLVDYYVARKENAQQIEITADKFGGTYYLEASTLFRDAATGKDMPAEFIIPKFGGNYYLEASTLFRDTNGVDMPAEFIIPNCKIQSNFTFTMASSGDPSTFTFTMDAFPDYTRFDRTKKVLAAIQIMSETDADKVLRRVDTNSTHIADTNGIIIEKKQ